jgi:hypothetical protein
VNETSLRDSIPPIKRARGCYLYDFKGGRYLDLYRQNGAALLGHRPANLTRVMKQVMAKGLIADLPSVYEGRLRKAVLGLLPGFRDMRAASCEHRALELAALYVGGGAEGRKDAKGGTGGTAAAESGLPSGVAYWRPLWPQAAADDAQGAGTEGKAAAGGKVPETARVLIPILPLAVGGGPVVVCFRDKLPQGFPASDQVSPMLLAGLTRAVYDLSRHVMPDWYADTLLAGAPGWEQRGPYILAHCGQARYVGVFQEFLKQGFLLAPDYPGPSILPWEVSPGELKKMCKLFNEIPGE